MQIRTRPSVWFWLIALLIYGFCVLIVLACHLAILISADADPYGSKVFLGISAAVAALPAWLYIRSRARRCTWRIDFGGMSSPAFGRIDFAHVVALYIGYPQAISLPARAVRTLVAPGGGFRHLDAGVRILKMADGRLFPLDLEAPVVSGYSAALAKVTELLVGKLRPNSDFDASEIEALRSRPANRFVSTKGLS